MSVESTRKVMQKYWDSQHSDVSMMARDVVFKLMGTDLEYRGPEAVNQTLHWFYHVAFEARAETTNTLVGDGKAMLEGTVIGKHVDEYAGIPATGKDFRVPICVTYQLENDQIKEGRVYFLNDVLLRQLGVLPTPQVATA
ncbi:MAG: ester cyclase [Armatimonadota bacterium]